MSDIPREERVRALLCELRSREDSFEVREDIEKLERILENPVFRQLSQKSLQGKRPDIERREASGELVDFLRASVESDLKSKLKNKQRLNFVNLELSKFCPIVLETVDPQQKLIVVGPKDIKTRSAGRLRIGDRIKAIVARNARGKVGVAFDVHDKEGVSSEDIHQTRVKGRWLIRDPNCEDFDRLSRSENIQLAIATVRETQNMVKSVWLVLAAIPNTIGITQCMRRFTLEKDKITCHKLAGDWTQVEIVRLSTDSGGLGFGIVGGASTGVVVKTILPGSPADKDRRLRPGDHILQIANVNTHGMTSQQVAAILRQQENVVNMIVGRPINYAERPEDTKDCWTMSTRAALNAATLEEHLLLQHRALQEIEAAEGAGAPVDTEVQQVPEASERTKPNGGALHADIAPSTSKESTLAATIPETNSKEFLEEKSIETPAEAKLESTVPVEKLTAAEVNAPAEEGEETSPLRDPDKQSKISISSKTSKQSVVSASSPPIPTTTKISLKTLQEMDAHACDENDGSAKAREALTVFLRENWEKSHYELVEVDLVRDAALGLGITVAGYVHRKEEIGGVFVKSVVPRSAASSCGKISVHDLILQVNGVSLEHLSHADSVRTLVKSGQNVHLKLIRFSPESAQAQCLKMLQEQETDTQVIDVQSSTPDLASEWKKRIPNDVDIITAVIRPDKKDVDGGLGISLEGTVDVLNGAQLCPHHYIESIRENGPTAKNAVLRGGDELLQVNHSRLFGESHVTVRQALSRAVHSGAPVTLVVARRKQHMGVYQPTTQKSLPLAFSLLAQGLSHIVKAKSELSVPFACETEQLLQRVNRRLRSKSLELFTGLAIWNCVPLIVTLEKDTRGLGFSIVDYQDPSHLGDSVIVVQSLVPGGVAQADGRIVPGDRLLFVNKTDLSNSSLERAVAVLKSTPMGRVTLGIAKPVPVDQVGSSSHSPLITRSERLLARGSSPRRRNRLLSSGVTSSQETVWIGADSYRKLHPQSYFPSRSPSSARSERSLDGSESMASWSPCSTRSLSPAGSPRSLRGSWAFDVIYLPAHLERSVQIQKGPLALGIVLDADKDKGVNGCVVTNVCGKKAIAGDGRIQVGDYIVKINTESLRNVTSAQAKAILKRTNLIGNNCNVTYITSSDAKLWKERFHREETASPIVNRLSPKVFPKFYRSPYLGRKPVEELTTDTDDDLLETQPPSEIQDISVNQTREVQSTQLARSALLARVVDGWHVDELVTQFVKEAVDNALFELGILNKLNKTPDWKGRPSLIPPVSPSSPPPSPSYSLAEPISCVVTSTTIDQESINPYPEEISSLIDQPSVVDLKEQVVREGSPLYAEIRKFSTTSRESQKRRKSPEAFEGPESPISETGDSRSSHSRTSSGTESKESDNVQSPQPPRIRTSLENLIRRDSEPSLRKTSKESMTKRESPEKRKTSQDSRSKRESPDKPEQMEKKILTDSLENTTLTSEPTQVTQKFQSITSTPGSIDVARDGEEEIKSVVSNDKFKIRSSSRSKFWGEARTVSLHREPNKSFGISIVGGRVEVSQKGGLPGTGSTVSGIFIKSVLPNSPAGKTGLMNMGDRVISVNDVDLREATHEHAVKTIKNATNPVRFVLQSLHSFSPQQPPMSSSSTSVASVRVEPTTNEENPVVDSKLPNSQQKEKKAETVVAEPAVPTESSTTTPHDVDLITPTPESVTSQESTPVASVQPLLQLEKEREMTPTAESIQKSEVPQAQPEPVIEPTRTTKSSSPQENKERSQSVCSKTSVHSKECGAAARDDTKRGSLSSRSSSKKKKESIKRKEKEKEDRKTSFASAPLIVSDVSSSETHDDESFPEDVTSEKLRLGIEPESAAFQLKTIDDTQKETQFFYTNKKIQRKYGDVDGELLIVDCDRVPEAGLGISLAGNKDRDKLNVFVVSVKIACPLPVRVGDELLEVNGRILRGLSHVIASNKVRTCCEAGPLELVVCRAASAIDNCAVKPSEMPSLTSIETERTSSTTGMPASSNDESLQLETVRKKSFSVERTTQIETSKETLIEIDKEGRGLGLSIVGGSDTVLGTVVIHEVYPDGAAAHDNRLKPGDQVLEVNGISLRGVGHDQAISTLRRTPPKVRLLIFRDVSLQLSLLDPTQIYNMFEVELLKKPGRGLGLSIVGRKNEPGVYVSEVVKGGSAEADSRLMPGDQILAVNNKDVANSMQEDVAAMLKTCIGKVHLKVGRWKLTETTNRVHAAAEAAHLTATMTTPRLGSDDTQERPDVPPPAPPQTTPPAPSSSTPPRPTITHTSPDGEPRLSDDGLEGLSPVTEEPSSSAEMKLEEESMGCSPSDANIELISDLSEEGSFTLLVELKKIPDQQLGMGIGKRTRGILVTSLQPGSQAAEKLKVGDRILAVNALPVSDQLSAVTFVKASGNSLFLQIARPKTVTNT